jgi:hypothetical protein
MKSIQFSEHELEILKMFYYQELDAAIEDVTRIKQILIKLGNIEKKGQKPLHTVVSDDQSPKKRGRPRKD